MNLFQSNNINSKVKRIVIPKIQRDYAQGRENKKVSKIRDRFLDALYQAITEDKPIKLDFIYGEIKENRDFIPLDGQQRLTTLFLLHYYAAKKAKLKKDKYEFLNDFTYETRYSSNQFCKHLINDFNPEFNDSNISSQIRNQYWYAFDYDNDPTIKSMLVMLDAIDKKFKDVSDLWDKLKKDSITFYFLSITNLGSTDEFYVKMNSRGKPLTTFENVKAELERTIKEYDETSSIRIAKEFDTVWTDLLWKHLSSDVKTNIDDLFIRYFKFICNVLRFENNHNVQESRTDDEFELIKIYFSFDSYNRDSNIKLFESFFDCWKGLDISEFFFKTLANSHDEKKIVIDGELNLFKKCLYQYGESKDFTYGNFVLLYAICTYLNLNNKDKITEEQFLRRLRIINNLIKNSSDQLADRNETNTLTLILKQTKELMLYGTFNENVSGFNSYQVEEEKEKNTFLNEHPDLEETLYKLEDYDLLYGQIAILGLENIHNTEKFISLFECDKDLISCALLTCGDYGYQIKKSWHYQYATKRSETWMSLMHRSSNHFLDQTRVIFKQLLDKCDVVTSEKLNQIIENYLKECEDKNEYTFNYYFIKYKNEFRPGDVSGLIRVPVTNKFKNEHKYWINLLTKSQLSPTCYNPYIKATGMCEPIKERNGEVFKINEKYKLWATWGKDNQYEIENIETKNVELITIKQNSDGIDSEDRVKVLKEKIKELR